MISNLRLEMAEVAQLYTQTKSKWSYGLAVWVMAAKSSCFVVDGGNGHTFAQLYANEEFTSTVMIGKIKAMCNHNNTYNSIYHHCPEELKVKIAKETSLANRLLHGLSVLPPGTLSTFYEEVLFRNCALQATPQGRIGLLMQHVAEGVKGLMEELLMILKDSGKVGKGMRLEKWQYNSKVIHAYYEDNMNDWVDLVLKHFPPISDEEGLRLLEDFCRANINPGYAAALLIPGVTPEMLPAPPPTTPRVPEIALPPSPPAPAFSPVISATPRQPILHRLATGDGDFSPTYGFTAPEQFESTPPRSPFQRRDSPYPYPNAPASPSPTEGMFSITPTSAFSDGFDSLLYNGPLPDCDWESLGLMGINGTGALMRGLRSPQLASVNAITGTTGESQPTTARFQMDNSAAAAGLQAAQSPYSSGGSDISSATRASASSSTSSGVYAAFGYPYNNGVSLARPGKDACVRNILETMVQVHRVASLSLTPLASREVKRQQQQWIRWLDEVNTIVVDQLMPPGTHPNTRAYRESALALTRSAKAKLESLILQPSSGEMTHTHVALGHATLYKLLHDLHNQLVESPSEMYPVIDTWSSHGQPSSAGKGQHFRLPPAHERIFQQGSSSGRQEGATLNTWSPTIAPNTSSGLRSNYVDALRAANPATWHRYSSNSADRRPRTKAQATARLKRTQGTTSMISGSPASKRARRN